MNAIKTFILREKHRIIPYILGFFTVGFGVNLMKASDLGVGAWDTVTFNLRDFIINVLGIEWVTPGMISLLISTIIMLIVISYRKNGRYLFMLIPMLLVFVFIDFWFFVIFENGISGLDFWVKEAMDTTTYFWQYIFFVCGSLILPLGLVLIIKSAFPAFVFDEWMLMMMDIYHAKKIIYVRVTIELTGITIGALFGYLTYYQTAGDLGSVNWGSMVFTILFTPIMAMWFHFLKVRKNDETIRT